MTKLLKRACNSLHIASSVFSCIDSMTITTAYKNVFEINRKLADTLRLVFALLIYFVLFECYFDHSRDLPHTLAHGGNVGLRAPAGTGLPL